MNSRQIILDTLCIIHTHNSIVRKEIDGNETQANGFSTGTISCKIISNIKGVIYWKQELPKDGYYGFFDRPMLFHGKIENENISLIQYLEPVKLIEHPTLDHYRVGDKVLVKVANHRTGLNEFRDATVTKTGLVHPNYGSKHSPYPYIQVDTIFTYWKTGENNVDEFYEKENTTRYYTATDVKFHPNSLINM